MHDDSKLALAQIGQIALPVHDLDKAVAFYRDVLGLPFLYQFPGLAFFDCAGVRLMLSAPESAEFDKPGSVLHFRVDEIAGAYETLQQRGAGFQD